MLPYAEIESFVQQLTPTWRKTQHRNFARLIGALLARGSLTLTELARTMPCPTQPLHGRLKRLGRFLTNPRLDEATLCLRWFKLAYRFGAEVPARVGDRPIVPLLLDTVCFEPFALLVSTIPCGSRGLPVALTTYHRYDLQACFLPRTNWPSADELVIAPRPQRPPSRRATGVIRPFLSQNQIEEEMVDYAFHLLSPALRGVTVADRGFARASFFRFHQAHQRAFVIRFSAQTHIRLPTPLALDRPTQGPPAQVLALRPGERIWCPQAWYGQDEQVPIALLAVWDKGQAEPWYLATTLETAAQAETLYRWRMRLECANRDEKTGVILRTGGDAHALRNLLHVHRLLLALCAAEWLCALTGLQAWQDLSTSQDAHPPDEDSAAVLAAGPAPPPPIVPHRGLRPKLPPWMKRFAAWGPLSYVRLGAEVLQAADLISIVRRLVRWLTTYLWPATPLWRPWHQRYRQRAWWPDSS